jgi:hypothetical protein
VVDVSHRAHIHVRLRALELLLTHSSSAYPFFLRILFFNDSDLVFRLCSFGPILSALFCWLSKNMAMRNFPF